MLLIIFLKKTHQLNIFIKLALYILQLKQIRAALEIASEEQKHELKQIEKDLEEIIELTKSSQLLTTAAEEPVVIDLEQEENDSSTIREHASHLEVLCYCLY